MNPANPNGGQFSISYYNKQGALPQETVRVYYIGMLNEDGTSPIITLGGRRTMQLPPIGEGVDVPENVAKTIEFQTTYRDEKGVVTQGTTRDPRVAAAVKAGKKKGLSVSEAVNEAAIKDTSTEALMAELKARGALVDAVVEGEDNAEETDESKEPAAPKNKGGRPKKDEVTNE